MSSIEELKKQYEELAYLHSATALLGWDMRTYLPPEGSEMRAEVIGYISTLAFKKSTCEEMGRLIRDLNEREVLKTLSQTERAMVRVATKTYKRAVAIPPELYQKFAVLTAKSEKAWERARENNDFERFSPHLEEIVAISREFAKLYGYEENPYDALLEGFEEGMTAKKLRQIIKPLRDELVPFLRKLMEKGDPTDGKILEGRFPKKAQEKLAKRVLKLLGYDFQAGRLDETVHPFTINIGLGDVRVTTKYPAEEFTPSLYGSIHEGGHGLYEQGLPAEFKGTPLYGAASFGVHESQSRLMENMIGRSEGFLKFFYPQIQKAYPKNFKSVRLEEFYSSVNRVRPSTIRIEADEVTYNFHIMLRFELEEALIKGELEVKDLPAAWSAKSREYLGVEPASHRDGVLQDVHWPSGMIGYFPSYMLGNLYAAQLYSKAQTDIKGFSNKIEKGDFKSLLEWLKNSVHNKGRLYPPEELIRVVTGEELNPGYFIEYVKAKYSKIYSL